MFKIFYHVKNIVENAKNYVMIKEGDNMNLPIKRKETKKQVNMANKGMDLEEIVNEANEYYLANDIAIIHKKPIPVQIVHVDYPARNKAVITEAYYKTPSTTDYNGIYKGYYIDFDCKECNSLTSFPLKNVHPHQVEHLKGIKKHGGIAFLLIEFIKYDEYYLLNIDDFLPFWDSSFAGERKSISYNSIKELGIPIFLRFRPRIDYLKGVETLIERLKK